MTAAPDLDATPLSSRAAAPDLARGGMLLLIALANVHVYSWGHALGPRGYPRELSVVDQAVVLLQMLLVDGRAYPLFAILFGYGTVQLTRRRMAAGFSPAAARSLVRRRGWWMILIGFLHGVLLWPGDIIGAYGLIAVLFAGVLVLRSTRALVVMAIAGALVSALLYSGASLELPGDKDMFLPSMAEGHAGVAMGFRILEWLGIGFGFGFAMAFGAVALGVLAGRHRVLDDPDRFVPLLRGLAVCGLGTAVLLGLPLALMAAQVIEVRSIVPALAFGSAHALGGYAGGVGYAALFGLLAIRLRGTPGIVTGALIDSGRRSMSSYLAQSVVFVALLPAWTLGLGGTLKPGQLALVALAAWALITAVAAAAGRAGYRGPAEVLLRRLTYGRTPPRERDARRSGP